MTIKIHDMWAGDSVEVRTNGDSVDALLARLWAERYSGIECRRYVERLRDGREFVGLRRTTGPNEGFEIFTRTK
jgi:hypothetical protein